MPISKINSDGTVKIYNSNTGEVKDVAPEDLASYNPKLVGDYQAMQSPEKVLERTKAEKELEEIQTGTKPLDEKTGAAKKTIDLLESIYKGGGEETSLAFGKEEPGGRISGTIKNIERQISPGSFPESDRLNTFKRTLESSRSQLAKAAGDAGNLALQEQILAGKALPDENSTPSEAVQLFASLRLKFGLPPLSEDEKKNILDQFKPEGARQDSAQAALDKELQGGFQQVEPGALQDINFQTAQTAIDKPQQEQPVIQVPDDLRSKVLAGLFPGLNAAKIPIVKEILAKRGANLLEKIDKGEQVTADEVVGAGGEMLRNALMGGGTVAAAAGGAISGLTKPGASAQERLTGAALEAALTGALAVGGKVVGKAKGVISGSAKNVAAETRNKLAEEFTKKVPVTKIVKEGERVSKNLPETANAWKKSIQGLKKEISATDLVEKIDFWGGAFKKDGAVKDAATAQLHSKLQRQAKEVLKEIAPDVAKAHEALRREAALKGGVGRVFSPFNVGAGLVGGVSSAAGALAISKLLSGNQ